MKMLNRRNVLKTTLASAGSLLALGSVVKAAESCGITPEQTEGPFYPINDQQDKDNDLTMVKGKSQAAKGEVIIITGKVIDEDCKPVENALVEIWQACASGKYNHPGDPNPAELDPDFQYWGRAITDENGEYDFKTIKPGHYPATNTWIRPAHIHFKVHSRGFEEITSQLYFEGDRFNSDDRILQNLRPEERKKVIVRLERQPGDNDQLNLKPRKGRFDIIIRSL